MRIHESVEIARPPEEVFALVADLGRAPEWQSSLESVDVERGVEVRRVAGQRREGTFRITDSRPPERLAIASRSGSVSADATFLLAPTAEGTKLDFDVDLRLGGAARFAGRMIRGGVEREARANLDRLRDLLER
jgi:carbon monoxide dehydrogenase subunit G